MQHARLRIIEIEQSGEQQRPHVGDGRAHWMPLLACHIPERRRAARRRPVGDAQHLKSLPQLCAVDTGCSQSGKIALDVGHENRHADARKPLGEHLQGNRLAGTGCTGDQSMTIG